MTGGKEFADLKAKHRKSELAAIPKAVRRVGVKEGAAKRTMAAPVENLAEWEKIAAEVGTDVDMVAAAFNREIYDNQGRSRERTRLQNDPAHNFPD